MLPTGNPYVVSWASTLLHLTFTWGMRSSDKTYISRFGALAVIILGDFTGRIGDPTGRSEIQEQLTEEEVMANALPTRNSLVPLDPERTEIKFNGQWLEKLHVGGDSCHLHYTVALIRERRFCRPLPGKPADKHPRVPYPLPRGRSVAINADIEFGATEQKFNLLMDVTCSGNITEPRLP